MIVWELKCSNSAGVISEIFGCLKSESINIRKSKNFIKMNKLYVVILLCTIFGYALCQFPNGRILEPPVPSLCAQRTIHERAPDGKG